MGAQGLGFVELSVGQLGPQSPVAYQYDTQTLSSLDAPPTPISHMAFADGKGVHACVQLCMVHGGNESAHGGGIECMRPWHMT